MWQAASATRLFMWDQRPEGMAFMVQLWPPDVFDESSEAKRPTVQVGDPFTEKLLIEACLEVMNAGLIVGIQDMGAAGLTSSSCEMAGRAGTGIDIHFDRVPMRETGMTPL